MVSDDRIESEELDRAYEPPALVVLGPLPALTRTIKSSLLDG